MPLLYPDTFEALGAELQAMRGIEAAWEWQSKVSSPGPTYFKDYINAAYDNGVQSQDTAETASKTSLVQSVTPIIASAHASRRSDFETYWLGNFISSLLPTTTDPGQEDPIGYTYDDVLLATGEVRIKTRTGPWGRIRSDMIDNAASIEENVVTVDVAFTGAADNVGTLTSAGFSGEDHALSGLVTFLVVGDTVGDVKLSATLQLDDPLIDGTIIINADNNLTVGKAFEDGPTGLAITLSLGALVETGDGGNMFATTSVTTPSEADSNKGKFYFEVERASGTGGNPDFIVRWYKDANFTPENLVQTKEVVGVVGTEVLTLVGSVTTIVTTFSMANAAVALPVVGNKDSDIIFDIGSPRLDDVWTMHIDNNEAGIFATKIAKRWRASLSSAAAPTISDALAASVAQT